MNIKELKLLCDFCLEYYPADEITKIIMSDLEVYTCICCNSILKGKNNG